MPARPNRIPKPILNYVRELDDAKGWQRTGGYQIWCGSTAAGEPAYVLHEIRNGVIVRSEREGLNPLSHSVPRNTPFHVSNLFGYWQVAECDMVWLEAEHEGTVYYSIMLGVKNAPLHRNECLWICPKCISPMARSAHDSRTFDIRSFLEFASSAVEQFNADHESRTCRSCGTLHPTSYGFGEGSAGAD